MYKIKKVSYLLLLASLCSQIHAQITDASANSFNIDPQFRALFLKASSSNIDYTAQAKPIPIYSPNWKIFGIKPEHAFGFDVGIGIVFNKSHVNVKVNYIRFDSEQNTQDKTSINHSAESFGEMSSSWFYTNTSGKISSRLNTFNFNFRKCLDISPYLNVNLFAGVSYAKIEQDIFSYFSNPERTVFREITNLSHFKGAGPQVGLDFTYNIYCGLEIRGLSSLSILIGKLENHKLYYAKASTFAPHGVKPIMREEAADEYSQKVVPALEERLALAYNHDIYNASVRLEAGFNGLLYFNALKSIRMRNKVAKPPIIDKIDVFAKRYSGTTSNFLLTGPYLSIDIAY